MLEKEITEAIQKFVVSVGGKCIKFHGNAYTEVGTPDLIGSVPVYQEIDEGFFIPMFIHFFVECKLPGEEPEEIQKFRLQEWHSQGYATGVAHSLDDFQWIIMQFVQAPTYVPTRAGKSRCWFLTLDGCDEIQSYNEMKARFQ